MGSMWASVMLQQTITHVREQQGTMRFMSDENAIIDEQIQVKIVELREIHHACTARAVANVLGASPDVIRYRCSVLRDRGLIIWDDMPGSLRIVDQADGSEPGSLTDAESPAPAKSSKPAVKAKAPTKKAASRKATARKRTTARKPKSA